MRGSALLWLMRWPGDRFIVPRTGWLKLPLAVGPVHFTGNRDDGFFSLGLVATGNQLGSSNLPKKRI